MTRARIQGTEGERRTPSEPGRNRSSGTPKGADDVIREASDTDGRSVSAGITQEVSAVQQQPQGDLFVVYVTGEDLAHGFTEFAASQTEFDRWFKQQVKDTTGADMNTPPTGQMSEILADTAG
jgi:hypothetical protein